MSLGCLPEPAPYRVVAQTTAKMYHLATFTSGLPVTADSPIGRILTRALAGHGYKLGVVPTGATYSLPAVRTLPVFRLIKWPCEHAGHVTNL